MICNAIFVEIANVLATDYIIALEKISGARISAIGVGPGRDAIIVRHDMLAIKN
jgi:adenylosuccinate synthase